jgi:amino acid transporter
MLESISLIILRKKEPNLPRPFKIRGGIPALVVIVSLPILLVGLLIAATIVDPEERATMLPTALVIASGPLVYGVLRWQRLKQ